MKEIDLLKETQEKLERIGRIIDAVNAREKVYREKLASLNEMLLDLFAKMELKEGATSEEIDEVKDSIRLFEERIDEIPITLKGLEPWRLRAQYKVRDIIKQIEKLYQSIKAKVKDGDSSPGLIEQIRACAPHVGMVEDCEEFLSKLNNLSNG